MGTAFLLRAPDDRRISMVGDSSAWDGRRHPMRQHGATRIRAIFVPDLARPEVHKSEIPEP